MSKTTASSTRKHYHHGARPSPNPAVEAERRRAAVASTLLRAVSCADDLERIAARAAPPPAPHAVGLTPAEQSRLDLQDACMMMAGILREHARSIALWQRSLLHQPVVADGSYG